MAQHVRLAAPKRRTGRLCVAPLFGAVQLAHRPGSTEVQRGHRLHSTRYRIASQALAVVDLHAHFCVHRSMLTYAIPCCRVKYHPEGPEGPEVEIDFGKRPWRRVPIIEGLEQRMGCSIPRPLESEETCSFLQQQVRKSLHPGCIVQTGPTCQSLQMSPRLGSSAWAAASLGP